MENKVFYHYTYNMELARAALEDDQKVYCTHPDKIWPDDPLTTIEQIEDAEGHFYLVEFSYDC